MPNKLSEKFGTLLGTTSCSVESYSSDYDSLKEGELSDRHTFRHYGVF